MSIYVLYITVKNDIIKTENLDINCDVRRYMSVRLKQH